MSVILAAGFLVAAAIVWAARSVVREVARLRVEAARARAIQIVAAFAPAIAAAEHDPNALITWQPIAESARRMWPAEFAAVDAGTGGTFPFPPDRLRDAHARWTTDWLAWERAHDAEYKMKIAAAEHELAASGGAPFVRARLDALEREKLDAYQRRYEEYIRIAKKLQALAP